MGSGDPDLTISQVKALSVLLRGGSNAKAAKAADVSERTVFRWASSPQFVAAMEAHKAAIVAPILARAKCRLAAQVDGALDALADCLAPTYPHAKLAKSSRKRRNAAELRLKAALEVFDRLGLTADAFGSSPEQQPLQAAGSGAVLTLHPGGKGQPQQPVGAEDLVEEIRRRRRELEQATAPVPEQEQQGGGG